jgi:hypothetical protein
MDMPYLMFLDKNNKLSILEYAIKKKDAKLVNSLI